MNICEKGGRPFTGNCRNCNTFLIGVYCINLFLLSSAAHVRDILNLTRVSRWMKNIGYTGQTTGFLEASLIGYKANW